MLVQHRLVDPGSPRSVIHDSVMVATGYEHFLRRDQQLRPAFVRDNFARRPPSASSPGADGSDASACGTTVALYPPLASLYRDK
ncbi:hypothetical protein [Arthrobacter sp. QXT-31]|uniref:hypothetical protein n=1 Tax=Arthrobacter sp. QXT-31 TaxID=1357915 RepID=UPI001560F40E|nr:hypothetical protein [Arthrobacter sp. QXT-31]